ncbi:MAG: zinc-finger domain-containing protein [Pseudomonadota bacterium]
MTDQMPTYDAPEVIIVDDKRVACDGGGGALGHPIVFYEMGDDDLVVCGYCGRQFVFRGSDGDPTRA